MSRSTGVSLGLPTQNAETQRAAPPPAVEQNAANAPQSPVVIAPSRHVPIVRSSRHTRLSPTAGQA